MSLEQPAVGADNDSPRGWALRGIGWATEVAWGRKNGLANGWRVARVGGIDMKNNPLITVSLGVLMVGAFVTVGLAVGYERHYRQLRVLQAQMVMAQNSRNLINALADDAVVYSRRNPAIDPILQAVGAKPGKAAAASQPPTK